MSAVHHNNQVTKCNQITCIYDSCNENKSTEVLLATGGTRLVSTLVVAIVAETGVDAGCQEMWDRCIVLTGLCEVGGFRETAFGLSHNGMYALGAQWMGLDPADVMAIQLFDVEKQLDRSEYELRCHGLIVARPSLIRSSG